MLTAWALTYNLMAVILLVAVSSTTSTIDVEDSAWAIIIAALFFLFGVPGARYLWHAPVYRGLMADGAFSFGAFFFAFLLHIVFAGWSFVAPQFGQDDLGFGAAHAGLLPAIDLAKDADGSTERTVVAAAYFIGAFFWLTVTLVSVLFLGRVYRFVRGRA